MKKLLALLLALFILTLAGCNTAENTSSDIDTNSSEIVSSNDETSSDEAGSETSSEESSSQTSVSSKNESSSTSTTPTSKTENNTIKNADSDCVQNTTPKKTVITYKKTTYYGYSGYFTLSKYDFEIDLTLVGLGDKNAPTVLLPTEYYCDEFDKPIWFACNKNDVNQQDITNCVDAVGRNKIHVNIITSDCISNTSPHKTITLNKKTTYYGYPGYFTNYSDAKILLVELGLSNRNDWKAICTTEFNDIETGSIIYFIFDSQELAANGFMLNIDDNGHRAEIPAKITNIRTDAFDCFDQPINQYLFWQNAVGNDNYDDVVKIYTTEENEKYETEIYAVFKEKYGYEANVPLNTNAYPRYYIDNSGKPYSIYHYMLSVPNYK